MYKLSLFFLIAVALLSSNFQNCYSLEKLGVTYADEITSSSVDSKSSEKAFIKSLLQDVIYQTTPFDTEMERIKYAEYKSRAILEEGNFPDSLTRQKFYIRIMEEDDFYQRLSNTTKDLISSFILKHDSQSKAFYNTENRERSLLIRNAFKELFKEYLSIDFEKGKIYELSTGLDITKDLKKVDEYTNLIIQQH